MDSTTPASGMERVLVFWVLFILVAVSWIWGGGHPQHSRHLNIPALSLVLFLLSGLLLSFLPGCGWFKGIRTVFRNLLRDPLTYLSAIFLGLLYLHVWNARIPRDLVSADPVEWLAFELPVAWLPAGVTEWDAGLFFLAFFNALVPALIVRNGIQTRAGLRLLFAGVLTQGALLALFGLVQFASGTDRLYWIFPRERHFFAGFHYENHAGQYFYLLFSLALGWVAHRLCKRRDPVPRGVAFGLALLVILLAIGAVLSLSRVAMVLTILLGIVALIHIPGNLSGRLPLLTRFYLICGLVAVGLVGFVLFSGGLGDRLGEEFIAQGVEQPAVREGVEARTWQWKAAIAMWKDEPVWGIGSGGFPYVIPFYTPGHLSYKLNPEQVATGQVHNDLLQYLAEWGGVGLMLFLAILVALFRPIFVKHLFRWEIAVYPLCGALLVLAHSFVDLPFRSPAILAAWMILLAAIGRFLQLRKPRPTTLNP